MATCYNCGGYKPDGGSCPTCRKIESDKRLAEEQMEANREIAATQMKAQIAMTAMIAKDNQKKHDALMEQEEIRLKELKKQTQILLEQGLNEDEVYQRGFNFDDKDLPLFPDESDPWAYVSIDEKGNYIIGNVNNPYVQEKFKKAYLKGVNDKLKQDYSKGPGIEFMSEAAFNCGYTRNVDATICYPSQERPRYRYDPEIAPDFSGSVDEDDGSLEFDWVEPYDSDVLNQSFEAGVEKYLKEQNTAEKKNIRLAEIQQEQAKQRAFELANDEAEAARAKLQAEKDSQEKIAKSIKGAIGGGLLGAFSGVPIFFFIWFFSIFFGGTSWTLVGCVQSLAALGVVVGLFSGL
jgi:hypothetical protein